METVKIIDYKSEEATVNRHIKKSLSYSCVLCNKLFSIRIDINDSAQIVMLVPIYRNNNRCRL